MWYKFLYTLIIFLLIVQLCCGMLYALNNDISGIELKNLYLDNLKTGDIFMISYNNPYSFYTSVILMQPFSHLCMFVREEDNDYIIEYTYYNENCKGVIKIPFHKWLNVNKNQIILRKPLLIENDNNTIRLELAKKINKVYEKHKSDKMHILDYSKFAFPSKKYTGLDENFVCVEFVSEILAQTGIRDISTSNDQHSPNSYFKNIVKLNKGYKYDEKYICNMKYLPTLLKTKGEEL